MDQGSTNTASIKDWPAGSVARTTQDSAASADLHIKLDGRNITDLNDFSRTVSEALNLPAFAARTPKDMARAVDRRVWVLARSNESLNISLSHADELPEAALRLLLNWVETTPVKLALTGACETSAKSAGLLQDLGIELLDVDEPSLARETTSEEKLSDTPRAPETLETAESPEVPEIPEIPELSEVPEVQTAQEVPEQLAALAVEEPVNEDSTDTLEFTDDLEPLDLPDLTEPTHKRGWWVAAIALVVPVAIWILTSARLPELTQQSPITTPTPTSTELLSSEPVPVPAPVPTQVTSDISSTETPSGEALPSTGALPSAEATSSSEILPAEIPSSSVASSSTLKPAEVAQKTEVANNSPKGVISEPASEPAVQDLPEPVSIAATIADKPGNLLSANTYTIQIASYVSIELRDKFLQNMSERPVELRGAESNSGGRFKNLLVYGSYPDYASAARAIATLPPALQKSKPFPIKSSKLKP